MKTESDAEFYRKFSKLVERFGEDVSRWMRQRLPEKPMRVPFSEVPVGDIFWWKGKPYVKESENVVFLGEPILRPFPWREAVEVYPPIDKKPQ